MRIVIHNVDHGQCAVITPPSGERIMIDCGILADGNSYWWPSVHYMQERFGLLALTNLDEDHAEDFRSVMQYSPPRLILSNPTIGYAELIKLKKDGMRDGVDAVAQWMARPKGTPIPLPEPDFGPIAVRWYYNRYLPGFIEDTNNLSLVIIVQYGQFKILFSGDMEQPGWRNLLRLPAFRTDLLGVNAFVTSHHGRESGCLTDLFDIWQPEIFIVSDERLRYGSQETAAWYRNRARGVPVRGSVERRYVYTTRSDGSLQIDVVPFGGWLIQPIYVHSWPASPSPVSF